MKKWKDKIRKILENKYTRWVVITSLIMLVVGSIGFVIGAYAVGWNVLEWFVSPMAITIYFLLAFVILPFCISVGVMYWSNKDERKK